MSHVVRYVSSNKKPHCPDCGAFLAYQNITDRLYCRKCGFALAAETRRAETLGSGVKPFQSGPQGNAHINSVRQLPNGKIVKTRKKLSENSQLSLFDAALAIGGRPVFLEQEAF